MEAIGAIGVHHCRRVDEIYDEAMRISAYGGKLSTPPGAEGS